jgi:hypothetical protein
MFSCPTQDWTCAFMTIDSYLQPVETLLTCLAFVATFGWFCRQAVIKPRIEFDVACEFFRLSSEKVLAQVCFSFRNTGFVQHKIYRLGLSIYCASEALPQPKSNQEADFDRPLIDIASLVPQRHKYFFVRPGVHQVIRYSYILERPTPLISVRGDLLLWTPSRRSPLVPACLLDQGRENGCREQTFRRRTDGSGYDVRGDKGRDAVKAA